MKTLGLGQETVMVAALKAGRNSIGIEIDPEYCRMAADRLGDENQDLFSAGTVEFLTQCKNSQGGLILQETAPDYRAIHKKSRHPKSLFYKT